MLDKQSLENCNETKRELEDEFAEEVEKTLKEAFSLDLKAFRSNLRDGVIEVDVNLDKKELRKIFDEKKEYEEFEIETRGAAIGFLFKY